MKLSRWIIVGNVLVGYIYDHRTIKSGTRVMTEAIRYIDLTNFKAECLDGKYSLGEPGTYEEHNRPMIGENPESKIPQINTRIFLNPNG